MTEARRCRRNGQSANRPQVKVLRLQCQHRLAPSAGLDLQRLEHRFHRTSFVLERKGVFNVAEAQFFSQLTGEMCQEDDQGADDDVATPCFR